MYGKTHIHLKSVARLELNWREEIRNYRSSCKARPTNPKLYQAARQCRMNFSAIMSSGLGVALSRSVTCHVSRTPFYITRWNCYSIFQKNKRSQCILAKTQRPISILIKYIYYYYIIIIIIIIIGKGLLKIRIAVTYSSVKKIIIYICLGSNGPTGPD